MDAKIFICPNGHDLCEECFEQLAKRDARSLKCPTCKTQFVLDNSSGESTRNRSLEHLLKHSTLPCKFTDEGCNEKCLNGSNKRRKHIARCKHRLFKCPFGVCLAGDDHSAVYIARHIDCNIGLDLNSLSEHCKTAHNIDTFHSPNSKPFLFELDDLSEGEGHWRMFLRQHACENTRQCLQTHGELCPNDKCVFLMGFKSQSGEISLCARTITSDHVGEEYRIELTLPREDNVTFNAPLRCVSEPLGIEAKSGHILMLSAPQVRSMSRMNSSLLGRTVMKVFV